MSARTSNRTKTLGGSATFGKKHRDMDRLSSGEADCWLESGTQLANQNLQGTVNSGSTTFQPLPKPQRLNIGCVLLLGDVWLPVKKVSKKMSFGGF